MSATMTAAIPMSLPNLTPPPRVYARNETSAEEGLVVHSQEMQPTTDGALRQRQGLSTSTANAISSQTNTPEILTPSSTQSSEQVRDSLQHSSPATSWSSLLGNFQQHLPFKQNPKPPQNFQEQRSYHEIKLSKIEDHVLGVPRYAAFQNSNDSFCIFRRFGVETTRLLYHKQSELDKLSAKIHELDLKDEADPAMQYRLKSGEHQDWYPDKEQKKLLDDYEFKIGKYYDLMIKFSKIKAMGDVQPRHHRSVWDWVIDNGPITLKERAVLTKADDFVPIRNHRRRQNSKLENRIETWVQNNPKSRLANYLSHREQIGTSVVSHYSSDKRALVVRVIIGALSISSVLVPILLMFLLQPGRKILAVIVSTFVVLFMAGASELVDLTPHELFVLVAAYTAVLVTLLSNLMG